MYMVLEICGGGTLQQYLRKTKYLSEGLNDTVNDIHNDTRSNNHGASTSTSTN